MRLFTPPLIRIRILIIILIFLQPPIPKPRAPNPTNALPPPGLPHSAGVALVHGAGNGQRDDEDPDVAAAHGLPPAALDADLPEGIDASPRAVQEERAAPRAVDERPEAGQEAAEEEALRGQEQGARQPGLEEADAGPGGGDGPRGEGGHAEGAGEHPAYQLHRRVVQGSEAGEHEDRVEEEQGAADAREGARPEGKVGP